MAKILIVEDEPAIADLIALHSKLAEHESAIVDKGRDVLWSIEVNEPDVIILDVMLPDKDGFSLMEEIAPLGIPVIFLTAKDQLSDKLTGLRLGADDYLVKPFEALELMARIETVLKRYKKNEEVFRLGKLEVHLEEHVVLLGGKAVELTLKEFELLRVLIENKNLALSREKLLELVWDYDYLGGTRTVDVHIQRLRKKLNLTCWIKTIHKLGYRLEAPR